MSAGAAGGAWGRPPRSPPLRTGLLKASAPARVVNVSSFRHHAGTADGRFLTGQQRLDGHDAAYSSTKLMNLLFTAELARRLHGTGGCRPSRNAPCCAEPRWAVLCNATLCHAMLCLAVQCHTRPYCAML